MGTFGKSRVLSYIFLSLTAFYVFALGNDCETPKHVPGKCMPLRECRPIFEYLMKKGAELSPQERNYVAESRCNSQTDPIYVCCPLENNAPSILFPRPEIESEMMPVPPNCGVASKVISQSMPATSFYEYPWLALLEYTNGDEKGHFCTGALINKRFVLTAAHCVRRAPANWQLTGVRLGEWDTSVNPDCTNSNECADPYQEYQVKETIMHPNSTSKVHNGNDIALLYLSKDVAFSKYVQPICLPISPKLQSENYVDKNLETSGWRNVGGLSERKLKATARVWKLAECQRAYLANGLELDERLICAGSSETQTDSCFGDSGGPLMARETFNSEEAYLITGLLSFGPASCGAQGFPNVFTKVGPYMDWIKSQVIER